MARYRILGVMGICIAGLAGCATAPQACVAVRGASPISLPAAQPALAPAPPAPLPAPAQPGSANALATQYRQDNAEMDATYVNLDAQLGLADQYALSEDQTVWLNRRTEQCARSGAMDYACAIPLTVARIEALAAHPVSEDETQGETGDETGSETAPAPAVAVPVAPSPARVALRAPLPQPAAAPAPVPMPAPVPAPVPAPAVAPAKPPPAMPQAVAQAPPAPVLKIYSVAATAMPWVWQSGGINQNYAFGFPNGTPPTVVPLSTLGGRPGETVTLRSIAGHISIGSSGPAADAAGYAGLFDHGQHGALGPFPSSYMHPYPINLGELVGTFADAGGNIIGTPFAVGDGPVSRAIPPGASQLQLGINDDVFNGMSQGIGNAGAFTVLVQLGS